MVSYSFSHTSRSLSFPNQLSMKAWRVGPEGARPPPARDGVAPLDPALLAHHPQHPLAVHGDAELAPGQRPDHPVAVGRVLLRDLDDRLLDRTTRWPPLRRLARLR